MLLSDFTYQLPPELIAQTPAEPRDHSRLLSLNRETGSLSHHHFYDLPQLLQPGDLLVRNNTKVIPARLLGHKPTGGAVEILLTKRLAPHNDQEVWECLTRPGLKPGQVVTFEKNELLASCLEMNEFTRNINFNCKYHDLLIALESLGQVPIPPYIHWAQDDDQKLREVYQTTYAQIAGSAAAPTAGLHFTPKLDAQLAAKGIEIETVTLHVGLGTFLPVKTSDITQHHLHKEEYELTEATATRLNQSLREGRRIIAVGTTTCRVLETCALPATATSPAQLQAQTGDTEIFIYPPRKFEILSGLITNFHLPESTLLMLVSAFVTSPNTSHKFETFASSSIGKAYATAIEEKYRFFSFGDAMLII